MRNILCFYIKHKTPSSLSRGGLINLSWRVRKFRSVCFIIQGRWSFCENNGAASSHGPNARENSTIVCKIYLGNDLIFLPGSPERSVYSRHSHAQVIIKHASNTFTRLNNKICTYTRWTLLKSTNALVGAHQLTLSHECVEFTEFEIGNARSFFPQNCLRPVTLRLASCGIFFYFLLLRCCLSLTSDNLCDKRI